MAMSAQTAGMHPITALRATEHSDIASLVFKISDASGRMHLLPAGEFKAVDGRPENLKIGLKAWKLTPVRAALIAADVAARKTPLVIDYEHQTLHAMFNGAEAPAAGFFNKVEFDAVTGLSAVDVDWNEKAKNYIKNGEYRYASAVFAYDKKSGEVTQLLHAALTNNPGLDGLAEISALAAKHFQTTPTEEPMKTLLIAALALNGASFAKDEDLVTHIAGLKSTADSVPALEAQIVTLKASQFDATKHAPIAELTRLSGELAAALGRVSEFQAKASEIEVAALIENAMSKGKIVAATKDYFTEMGKRDIAALKSYIEKQPEIEALKTTQTGGKAPDGGAAAASFAVPPGASVDTERVALHSQALAYQAQHKTDYLAAYKAVGGN